MIEPLILHDIPDPERFFRKVNNSKRDYIYERQQRKLKMLETEYGVGQLVNK